MLPSCILALVLPLASVLAADFTGPTLPPHLSSAALEELGKRQTQQWRTQNWGNEFSNYTWSPGPNGRFAVDWRQPNGGNFVVGRGYSLNNNNRIFNYSGTFTVNDRAYMCLYAWTLNPLTEWYVIENMGVHNPADNRNATCHGRIQSDGGTYEVWSKWRINAPSIIGDADFQQYWSIRTRRHVGGTINTTAHLAAFRRAGLPLGAQQPVFLAVEGQVGSGAATLTAGVAPTTTVPESATPTARTELVPSRACTRVL
ncbi:hypothetical protein MCOR27_010990 [Pyricularia oryzae]|uniref:Endo-1,4-beta-xylanase n=5 Tax=Pyricularia TaxID=48558 RepID=A0ABQ8NVM8_PYRGI|nr:uncharacterized protein MGG_17154 [Pyricularia oryzae 70-15]ELQ35683.1 endo-1,4-beta-xylanase 2 [Pyricularia oryzae Y34]KAH8843648.1 hypothetical protein MCOR01_004439 [Pyricularia oryzae]KAI6302707.1 hypothetical protein MCOR33_001977 [Pyricularia grisea]EHA50618.1 hypothetical protein MGG_17154 [Pyricularia oryzae 70-15]KAH9431118.1 hypothetical protein MCOR02_008426 [Pyricularia oryzae]